MNEIDDRIAQTLSQAQAWAVAELGFTETAHRGDGELELKGVRPGISRNTNNWRITLETRFIHGQGRVVLVSKTGAKTKTSDILIRARDYEEGQADLETVKLVLRGIVRRITRGAGVDAASTGDGR